MQVVWIDPFAPVNVSHPLLEVQFSAEELEKCRGFAHHRNDAKMDAGIGDRTDYSGDWSRLENNFKSCQSEMAAAWLCGTEMVQLPGAFQGDGEKHDFSVNGLDFEVKFNNYAYGDFYFRRGKELVAHWGIQTVPSEGDSIAITGCVSLDLWKLKARPCQFDRHCLGVPQSVLLPNNQHGQLREELIQADDGEKDPHCCMGCGRDAAPIDGYCGTCWFEYVYRPKKFGHVPGQSES